MKAKLTQQSILLFEEQGFIETSIQDIVDAVSVTKGTFYYYFTSKEQLLMDIHSSYINELLNRQEMISQSSINSREKIKRIVELLVSDIEYYRPSARVFFREMRHLTALNADEIKQKRETFRLKIEQILYEGIENGNFRNNLQPEIVAFAILGITNWSYQWFNPKGKTTAKDLSEIYTEMILIGIK
ncbi:TetR/AcrR family transcriptional regulator [Paenisporosarcina sp. TG20]|uniref:TetR/AcrR family transcriptional regulator n=1 Tax=Paenisporosarcina sp. TG20 TaxID=1211706 RepID=UPI000307DFFD|nr:TetR/AcrR family transcriptional regulator [Paenisporosarcina sp. TG20]